MNDLENNNIVRVSGEITKEPTYSHEMFGEGFYEFSIKIKRLSDIFDIIPVTISERLIQDIDLNVGDRVHFLGQYRSYNKLVEDKSKLCLTVFVREFLEECQYDENEVVITIAYDGMVFVEEAKVNGVIKSNEDSCLTYYFHQKQKLQLLVLVMMLQWMY